MSLKTKYAALAIAAGTVLTSGLATAAMSASAATPSCGAGCADIFSWQFGNFHHPNFVLDVLRQGARVGQPIILFRESNADPAEDFSAEFNGTTSSFYAAGLVSPQVALHYGCVSGGTIVNVNTGQQIVCAPGSADTAAFEIEFAPFGANDGLCVGVASTAVSHEGVTLQPCGVTSKTVWIVDTNDQRVITSAGVPLINGSDTNFSHPFVLTYPAAGFPTDKPRPQLFVANLTGFTQPGGIFPVLGTVNSNQLWSAVFGVLP
jgi:hypothetical protein